MRRGMARTRTRHRAGRAPRAQKEMRSAMAEEKIAAIKRGETMRTDVEGPHDALNADILGFFGKSKHKLQGLRPVGEAGAN